MPSQSRWFWLLVALVLSASAVGSLFLIVKIYPNRPGKTPTLPQDLYTSSTQSTGASATEQGIGSSVPLREFDPRILLHTGLLHPWGEGKQRVADGRLELEGTFVLRGYPSEGRRLRMVGSGLEQFRLDLWHGSHGVRLERVENGQLRGQRLQNRGAWPIPSVAMLRDARFYRERTLTRIDGPIAFKWGRDAPFSGMDADHFAVRWTGFLHVPREGRHTFYLRSDDGSRLFVNGHPVVDAWTGRAMQWSRGSVFLVRGWHGLVLEYHEATLDAGVHLQWERPGKERSDVPREWTTPAADDSPDWLSRLKPTAVDPFNDPEKQGLLGVYHWGAVKYPPLPIPPTVELLAQVPWPWAASEPFAFDLLHQEGQVVLRRGEGPLLRVPMTRPPTAALLEIHGQLEVLQLLSGDSNFSMGDDAR